MALRIYFCSLCLVLFYCPAQVWAAMPNSLSIHDLRTEYQINPLGIDNTSPRFSWTMMSSERDQRQIAFQLLVAGSRNLLMRDSGDIWNSGKLYSSASVQILFEGRPLQSRERCYWKVRVWDQEGRISKWSEINWWEMGFLNPVDWQAQWIQPPFGLTDTQYFRNILWPEKAKVLDGIQRAALFAKTIHLPQKRIRKARAYASAKGLYYLHLNGREVDSTFFKPGWTDYRKRIQYQVFDLTHALVAGANSIGVELGHGWYAGTVAFYGMHQYGKKPSFLLQLEIEFEDNTTMKIVTDASWKSALSWITANDMIHGETYDATVRKEGWNLPKYKHQSPEWKNAVLSLSSSPQLVASCGPGMKALRKIEPLSVTECAEGIYLVDMGQNMAGTARLEMSGTAGQKVQLRFGEILGSDHRLEVNNLYGARQTDTYILRGDGVEIYEPRFTMHGFRYIEIHGYPGKLKPENIRGIVLGAAIPETGTLFTSDTSINRLMNNIRWSFISNFTYVPTDCPQRIERQGWMGDAGLFAPTAAYLGDMASYFTKWIRDIADAQFEDGAFSDVSPRQLPIKGAPVGGTGGGTNVWGDAGIIIPWVMYTRYGDTQIIASYYNNMKRWIRYCKKNSTNLIRPDILYGDWLPPRVAGTVPAPNHMVNTAYFGYSALLMSKMAAAIGRRSDSVSFRQLFEDIRYSFNRNFVTANGYFKKAVDDTAYFPNQTLYALGLEAELFPLAMVPAIVSNLVNDIKKNGCLTTGIVGTRFINSVLTKYHHTDIAYQLLQNRKYPSWLNQIDSGATTIGEHWDSFSNTYTSRNHVALGAVGEWMFATIGGISQDNDHHSSSHFLLNPEPGGGISFADATYHSIYGTVKCRWRIADGKLDLKVEIPANTTATLRLPSNKQKPDLVNIGSGEYHYVLPFNHEQLLFPPAVNNGKTRK